MIRAHFFASLLLLLAICGSLSCNQDNRGQRRTANQTAANQGKRGAPVLLITIGPKTFTATMADNAAAKQFRSMLPLQLTMSEQSGTEKSAQLASRLPVELAKPQQIHLGDLLLRGPDTVVLFYQSFPTGFRYTPLGRIDNPTGLAEAVGKGEAVVKFALKPDR